MTVAKDADDQEERDEKSKIGFYHAVQAGLGESLSGSGGKEMEWIPGQIRHSGPMQLLIPDSLSNEVSHKKKEHTEVCALKTGYITRKERFF